MTGVRTKLPVEVSGTDENVSSLPLDQPVPAYVLGRRRHAISGGCESVYRSRPRMKRRGAVSYEKTDAAAEYIRYLGTCYTAKQKRGVHYK